MTVIGLRDSATEAIANNATPKAATIPIVSQVTDNERSMAGRANANANAATAAIRSANSHQRRTRIRLRLDCSRWVNKRIEGNTTFRGSRRAIRCNAIGIDTAATAKIRLALRNVTATPASQLRTNDFSYH